MLSSPPETDSVFASMLINALLTAIHLSGTPQNRAARRRLEDYQHSRCVRMEVQPQTRHAFETIPKAGERGGYLKNKTEWWFSAAIVGESFRKTGIPLEA